MSRNLVDYLVTQKGMLQKDIAAKLGVSRAQVSKWKAGEYIPTDRAEELRQLAGLFTDDVEWVELVETPENAEAWVEYLRQWDEFRVLVEDEEAAWIARCMLMKLSELGFPIPPSPPQVRFEIDADASDDECLSNELGPLSSLLCELMEDVGIYLTWRWEFMSDGDIDTCQLAEQLDEYAVPLALIWLKEEKFSSNGMDAEKVKSDCKKERHQARKIIGNYCKSLSKDGLPIMADYFIYTDGGSTDLDDMTLLKTRSIECYLPYGERQLLEEARKKNKLLEEINQKLS